MSISNGVARVVRQDDGAHVGVFGAYTVRTAFQPIFAFGPGGLAIVAYEGLARPFRDDEQLTPGAFFAAVPGSARLNVETMTRTAHLLNAGVWLDPSVAVFVNFDPSLFDEISVADAALRDMRHVLQQAGIDPRRVVCEVTEQKSPSEAALYRFVQALKVHGFRIAIDDYGSANSDINRVKGLKPDIVKFDAQWITRLMETGPGFALLASMVASFSEQGIETVFEGIEEPWQLELAEKAGASMVQGFVLARPEIVPAVFRSAPGAAAASAAPLAALAEGPVPAAEPRAHARARPFGRRSRAPQSENSVKPGPLH